MSGSGVVVLNTLVILAIVICAVLTVSSKKLLSSVVCLGATGAFVALEFIILQAPDVAIAEAAVGAVLSTALFVIALRKVRAKEEDEE
ncbi:MAG: DUF4040 domain-containing protein [Firmicutes bacterium]|nr:DUF4040 domain-containing protein [Bacillota bacterium]